MYKLAIIIPIHNGLMYTKRCLANLYQNIKSPKNIDIIISDDGSEDESAKWIIRNYPNVKILYGDGNLWWSGAVNLGVKFALEELKTDYIVLWNNDIECEKDYFRNLFMILKDANPKLIIGSLVMYKNKEKYILSFGGSINLKTAKKKLNFSGEILDSIELIEMEVDWLPGMGTIINKNIINDIGYWDSINCPQVYGDIDFTLRAKKRGYQIISSPKLKIFNDTVQTSILHQNSFKLLIKSLFYKNSNYNIYWDFRFHRKHFKIGFIIFTLLEKYIRYIGGFFKHKTINFFKYRFSK